jgi:outer membrane protein OmpA-like peptidoglycan-associated protein
MQKKFPLIVLIIIFWCGACDSSSSSKTKQDPKDTTQNPVNSDPSEPTKARWRNPIMTPGGADVSRLIRGYYLVGDYKKMLQFVIVPPCYTQKQLEYLLRKSKWGYDIKVNNLQWIEDSMFILNYRTSKQNTVGAEQYVGKIINDTAKIILFPEKENLFQYYGDEDLEDPCKLKHLLDNIYFAFDKTTLLPKSNESLQALTKYLYNNPSIYAHFIGHSSSEGGKEYNQKLSEGRAKAICDFLISKGIDKERLSYEGKGDTQPIEKNDTEMHKSANRRVEMVLRKMDNLELE